MRRGGFIPPWMHENRTSDKIELVLVTVAVQIAEVGAAIERRIAVAPVREAVFPRFLEVLPVALLLLPVELLLALLLHPKEIALPLLPLLQSLEVFLVLIGGRRGHRGQAQQGCGPTQQEPSHDKPPVGPHPSWDDPGTQSLRPVAARKFWGQL